MHWKRTQKTPAHVIVARMDTAVTRLITAQHDLADAQRDQRPAADIRASYDEISAAYPEALIASSAARAVRGAAMDEQIRELVIGEQEHWFDFDAGSGMQPMRTAHPASRAAFGPHISGMDYDPTPPDETAAAYPGVSGKPGQAT